MGPKSWVNSPAPETGEVKAGMVQIKGVALGGINAMKSVDVSIDGGKTWKQARLAGPDLGRYAWRQFVMPVKLKPGTYTVASAVTDAQGNSQHEGRVENTGGYNNNNWRDHALTITAA